MNRNISLRCGLYTNNSNIHTLFSSVDDINLIGMTASIGYETEFSSISLGIDYSQGNGKTALKNSENSNYLNLYDSNLRSYYLFFSGSYRL